MPLVASFDRIIWISETWEQFQSDQSNSQMNHSVRFANQFIEKNQLIHKSDSAIAIVDLGDSFIQFLKIRKACQGTQNE